MQRQQYSLHKYDKKFRPTIKIEELTQISNYEQRINKIIGRRKVVPYTLHPQLFQARKQQQSKKKVLQNLQTIGKERFKNIRRNLRRIYQRVNQRNQTLIRRQNQDQNQDQRETPRLAILSEEIQNPQINEREQYQPNYQNQEQEQFRERMLDELIQRLDVIESNGQKELKQQCQICMNRIQEGCSKCYLFCFHAFHEQCIKQWLRVKPVCPICLNNCIEQYITCKTYQENLKKSRCTTREYDQ